ncbi:MAG TPA: DUF4292 domain-containing protein [Bacteroidales bacterium]|nr:DUF4292 domain-containing protein [Bacteroidales bacterium]HPS16639.1 DUF4292 domain-containing protein [Bacteroidales bacterium]
MNSVKKIFWYTSLIGLLYFVFTECNPAKKIIKEPIKDKKADYLFAQLKKNEFKFNWLNIKFSATVKMHKTENSFNGNIRIKKDSIIWISVTPALGIEAFRALITNDSVKMLNRLNDTYISSDFAYITNLIHTDIDFDMLQSLLVGNDFSYYENNVFKATVDGMQYLLSTVGRGKLKKYVKTSDDSLKLLVQDIWLDPETYKISRVQLKELKENQKLEAEYSDIKTVDSLLFPFTLKYNASNEKEKIEIKLENTRVTTSGPLEFPFNISSKYQRIYK